MTKKEILLIIGFVALIVSIAIYPPIIKVTTDRTFSDTVNGWQIDYPAEIDSIELADEIGSEDIVTVLFSSQDHASENFDIGVSKTEFTSTSQFVDQLVQTENDLTFKEYLSVAGKQAAIFLESAGLASQHIYIVESKKLFAIQINSGAELESILKNFSFIPG